VLSKINKIRKKGRRQGPYRGAKGGGGVRQQGEEDTYRQFGRISYLEKVDSINRLRCKEGRGYV
jgi:hypothetical protein